MDNTFIKEKLLPQLTFNPGLALTGFRTTRPCTLRDITVLTWCKGEKGKTSGESCVSVPHQVIICLWMFVEDDTLEY